MIRQQDWPEKMAATIEAKRKRPFAWGKNDCALFCADIVLAMTGIDCGAPFRGSYDSEIGAAKALIKAGVGNLDLLMRGMFGDPLPAVLVGRGDIASFDIGNGRTYGICIGEKIAAPGETGLEFVEMQHCDYGWRV